MLADLSDEALGEYFRNTKIEKLTPNTVTDPAEIRTILKETRRNGYAIVDGEREQGVRSAGAPIYGAAGEVLAAINISVNAARVPIQVLKTAMVPRLKETAAQISRSIEPIAAERYLHRRITDDG